MRQPAPEPALIHELVRSLLPEATRARWQLRYLVRQHWQKGERELRLLPWLVDPDRAAFDVGANRGVYSWYLRRLTHAVHAFEPHPRMARRIRHALGSSVIVHNVGLSDHRGRALLRVPFVGQSEIDGYASLQPPGCGASAWQQGWSEQTTTIEVMPLDDLDLPAVAFIKIDVEGHETEVLFGARKTLERDRPAILIELEERHRTGVLESVPLYLAELGYRGYFLFGADLLDLGRFDAQTHQNPANVGEFAVLPGRTYINNFVFLPEPGAAVRARDIAARADLRP